MTKNKQKIVANINALPKYLSTDIKGACAIYELTSQIDHIRSTECYYKAIRTIVYDEGDTVVQTTTGSNADSLFITVRGGSYLPSTCGEYELTWFEEDETLDDIITMCST